MKICIKRDSGYADSLRNYEVLVDGKKIGTIADNERKDFHVKPGMHALYLKIDYIKSNHINFKGGDGEDLSFEIKIT
ncbi:MAG TPA: hypothetical protein VK694_07640 [Verrucomicrobiae bacterium]|nr:hypothetical protein [Verrucomicrobiae bacterium]